LKFICSLLSISIILTGSFSGCRNDRSEAADHIFVYDLSANPRTLDPQTAIDEHGGTVIANLFEGLLRMDSNGNITSGVAMEYQISDDLLVYTFYLKEDVYWADRNGFYEQCTAADFVFGFRRLFNPEVKSRNCEDYFAILNSRAINEGEMPVKSLGVYADGDFKLVIELEYPDANLAVLLTAPPAFPCNERFYIQAAGRYGLTADAVPSNTGFYLKEWVYDPHWTDENRIILRRRNRGDGSPLPPYSGYPLGVNLLMDRGDSLANFTSGKSDCIVVSGDGANNLIKRDFPYTGAETSVWGIGFSDSGAFSDRELRKVLAAATDRESIEMDLTGYRKTATLIPDSIKVGNEFFRDLAGSPAYTPQTSSKSIGTVTVPPVWIVPVTSEDDVIVDIVKAVIQQWQEQLSIFCKLEPLSSHEYAERLADGDYDIAAVKLTAGYNSPSAILNRFKAANKHLKNALQESSPELQAKHLLSAENRVLQRAELVPLCFVTEYFFAAKKSEDLTYNPFTRTVIFRNAKMY